MAADDRALDGSREVIPDPVASKIEPGNAGPHGRARRDATDEVMAAIAKLTGQVEAGVYNERPID